MKYYLVIALIITLISPIHAILVNSNLKGTKISQVYITKDSYCKAVDLNTKSLEFLLTRQLNEYGIYDSLSRPSSNKYLHIHIGCMDMENSEQVVFLVEVEVGDRKDVSDILSPLVIYFANTDFGYAGVMKIDEIVEESIKGAIKRLIDSWVYFNTHK